MLRFIIIISLILIVSSCGFINKSNIPKAHEGYLDLSNWDLEKNGIIDLDGEWGFYWNQLLSPSDFLDSKLPEKSGYINVPDTWETNKLPANISGQGYATYHLIIKLHPLNGNKLALKYLDASTSFTLWVDGEKLHTAGITGTSRSTTIPEYAPGVIDFCSSDREVEVIINISNFHHRTGGFWESISLGTEKEIHRVNSRSHYSDAILMGGILILSFYHLILYGIKKTDKKILILGIFCFVIFVRGVSTGEMLLYVYLTDLSRDVSSRIEYVSFFSAMAVFMVFLKVSFPKEIHKTVANFFVTCFLAVSIFSSLFPISISSYILPFVQILSLVAAIYAVIMVVMAVVRKRPGSKVFLIGFIIIIISLLNDILYARLVINSIYLSPVALVIFILLQTSDLSYRVSQSFDLIKKQHIELNNYKEHLEDLVKERTLDLENALVTAEESSRAKSDFLANMSHELRTPLTHIIGFSEIILMKEELMNSDPEAKEFLNDVLSSGRHLLDLISGILDLAKNKAGKQKIKVSKMDLGELLRDSIDIFSKQHNVLNFQLISGFPESISADYFKIKQILYNLLSNAVKFTSPGGEISIEVNQNSRGTTFCIKDNGIGIHQEDQERIFSSFEQIESGADRSYGGTGLGLALVTDFVTLHGGKIWVESKGEGMGSEFYFFIPLKI